MYSLSIKLQWQHNILLLLLLLWNPSLYHFILSQCASLVTEQILHTTHLLWNGTGPDQGTRDGFVPLNDPAVQDLGHIQVHPQAVETKKHHITAS